MYEPKLQQRFAKKYKINDSCWVWTAAKQQNGYGMFCIKKGDSQPAHRVSYQLAYGPLPDGWEVHHLCGNNSCVNPEHLMALSTKDHFLEHKSVLKCYAKCQTLLRLLDELGSLKPNILHHIEAIIREIKSATAC